MSIPYWRLSNFYFCYFATLGSFLPYWNLYLKQIHFTPAQIGELSAIAMGSKVLSPFLWGMIADRTGKRVKIIRWTSFVTAFLFSGFFFKSGLFWFALITLGYSFFWNASMPQFEAVTLFHLQQQQQRYSQIRLWGSIGFIVAVLTLGHYLDHHGTAQLPLLLWGIFGLVWLSSLAVPEINYQAPIEQANGIGEIFKKKEVQAFFIIYLLVHTSHAPYYVFYSIYLKQQHYSSTLIGQLWTLGVVAEIALFLVMQKILKRFSLRGILLISLGLASARWAMIANLNSLYWLAAAQLLHAASFGATHIVAIHLVHHYFGTAHQGKGQALYASLSFGLGGTIGSLSSGYYWEKLGGEIIYLAAAACCLLALLIAYYGISRHHLDPA